MEALEEQDESNGQVSGAKIKELLDDFQKQILTGMDNRLKSIKDSGLLPTGDQTNNEIFMDPVVEVPPFCDGKYLAFCYAEEGSDAQKIWQVPKDFEFPKDTRHAGWQFWMLGMSDYCLKGADGMLRPQPISPFCHFDPKKLPKKRKARSRSTGSLCFPSWRTQSSAAILSRPR